MMSKMGISTIRSYRGAQIFEAVGLNEEFIEKYFPGTSSRIGGIGIEVVAKEVLMRHNAAFTRDDIALESLDSGGNFQFRKFSEKHLYTAEAITLVHELFANQVLNCSNSMQHRLMTQVKTSVPFVDFLLLRKAKQFHLSEVEPAESIVKRFVSSAMSFGSISKEAHETIAIAMNRIGGASNTGEGGEDEERYIPLAKW